MAAKKKSTANRKGGASAQKGASKARASAEALRRKREIRGVVLIAVGILLMVYVFFSSAASASSALGNFLTTFPFGLFGIAAYALPFILIFSGILSIRGSRRKKGSDNPLLACIGVLFIIMFVHLCYNFSFERVQYMAYLKDAYYQGANVPRGGGLAGALLLYPLLQLGGKALAYIFIIAAILIIALILTRLSLRDVSETVSSGIHESVKRLPPLVVARDEDLIPNETRREKQYEFDLSSPPPQPPVSEPAPVRSPKRIKPAAAPVPNPDAEPSDDVPLIIETETVARPAAFTPPETIQLFGDHSAASKAVPKAAAEAASVPVLKTQEASPAVYVPPSCSLLNAPKLNYSRNRVSPNEKARVLVDALASFNVPVHITDISVGPTITRFELQPESGVRLSRITSLSNDIALALAAKRIRIEAPIPGKAAVGIEIPNETIATVVLRDLVESREFTTARSPITFALGKDIAGSIVVADLGKMPHMLIAGATGSGKSVCINDIIISMVYKSAPKDVRMILIDPKMVELSVYASLPHLLVPVVTDPKKAARALRWAVNEMVERYKKFSQVSSRDIKRYNELIKDPEEYMPRLVIIIDELADLMMVAGAEVEDCICRIAQLGRAAGIHLIVATQRPSVDVITGTIKANIPSRCAFAVSSGIDSRTIIDTVGAEKLLGSGDMLFHPSGADKPRRLQCAFVSDDEVERVVGYFHEQARQPFFDSQIVEAMAKSSQSGAVGGVFGEGKQEDDLLGEAVRTVIEAKQASTSLIQRKLRVGYSRAARLLDMMETAKYVSAPDGNKPRQVLIKREEYERVFGMLSEQSAEGAPQSAAPEQPESYDA